MRFATRGFPRAFEADLSAQAFSAGAQEGAFPQNLKPERGRDDKAQ
jgi:hypothetical protein